MVLYAARSHIGLVRQVNQDRYAVQSFGDWTLSVVADGMGGASAGEVASFLAADTVVHEVERLLAGEETQPDRVLFQAIEHANAKIWESARQNVDYLGMGTTVVAALTNGSQMALANVGDSRAYRLRNGELEQMTRDHSLVAELVRNGQITETEAQHHPQRNIVTRSLGTAQMSDPDISCFDVGDGDLVLLCTDGLTNFVQATEMAEMLAAMTSAAQPVTEEALNQAADALIRLALERGGADNVTLILALHRKEIGAA